MITPTPFGKYYLLDRINVGGMAEVFRAKLPGVPGFERIVALKRILPHIAEDEEFITMLLEAAKITVRLQHANIAQIFDLGVVDRAYFLVLEYIHSRNLRSIFNDTRRRRQFMPIQQICFVIMQVCAGLDHAHNKRDAEGQTRNLVHGDVSPQHILIGFGGEVKIIDFGFAWPVGKAAKTQASILKGKFGYMSPEQVRGVAIDRRSDIFALGILLYEMLTSERLFEGESDSDTLENVRNAEIVPPSSMNSQIPEKLERIVLKALAKDVEDRYPTALDLRNDLATFLSSSGRNSGHEDLSEWMIHNFPPAPTANDQLDNMAQERGLGWDDEELETNIYDRYGEEDSPRPQLLPSVSGLPAKRALQPAMSNMPIASLEEFHRATTLITAERMSRSTGQIWFRGQADSEWSLQPGIYRHAGAAQYEREMFRDFKLAASSFLESRPNSYLEWLFIMQHHGMPTRLLDWSENPLVALFFALSGRGGSNPVVWALDPWCLNARTLSRESIPTADDTILADYVLPESLPRSNRVEVPKAQWPAAIRPDLGTTRIAAQKGAFTIHGNASQGLDVRFLDQSTWQDPHKWFLTRIPIDGRARGRLLRELYTSGASDSSLFPGLDGLSRSITYRYSSAFMDAFVGLPELAERHESVPSFARERPQSQGPDRSSVLELAHLMPRGPGNGRP